MVRYSPGRGLQQCQRVSGCIPSIELGHLGVGPLFFLAMARTRTPFAEPWFGKTNIFTTKIFNVEKLIKTIIQNNGFHFFPRGQHLFGV